MKLEFLSSRRRGREADGSPRKPSLVVGRNGSTRQVKREGVLVSCGPTLPLKTQKFARNSHAALPGNLTIRLYYE
jgi:hypothetical protein